MLALATLLIASLTHGTARTIVILVGLILLGGYILGSLWWEKRKKRNTSPAVRSSGCVTARARDRAQIRLTGVRSDADVVVDLSDEAKAQVSDVEHTVGDVTPEG